MTAFRIWIIFMLMSLSVAGQNIFLLSGFVKDGSNGEYLIGSSVIVHNGQVYGTLTNEFGHYSLQLQEGKYLMTVKSLGYQTRSFSVTISGNQELDVNMTFQAVQLSEFNVQAKLSNDNITSSEIGVFKLNNLNVQDVPSFMGEKDILKTIQMTPGVKSVGEGSSGLFIRGGNNSQNLILMDGAPIYYADHLMGFFSTFNSDAIKDVELFKGTAPAQYGGRISSVVDVTMNDGNNQRYEFSGGLGLISSRLTLEGPIVKDKGSFMISGRRTYADLFLQLSDDEDIRKNKLNFYDLNIKANYRIGNNTRIYLMGYQGRDNFSLLGKFGMDWGNQIASMRFYHQWNDRLSSNSSLIHSRYSYKVDNLTFDGYSIESDIQNLSINHEMQLYLNDRHLFRVGISSTAYDIIPGQFSTRQGKGDFPVKLENRRAYENNLYVSNRWKPNRFFVIDYGFRLSYFQMKGPGTFYYFNEQGEKTDSKTVDGSQNLVSYFHLEPRINMALVLNPNSSVKLSYTEYTQNLHLISNPTTTAPIDIWLPSSNNIKPELGNQLSLGYFLNFSKDKFQFSSELYYRKMYNQIDFRNGADITANELIEGELLYGSGRAYGWENLLRKQFGRLNGWLAYTLSRSERQINGINHGNWYPVKQDILHDISLVTIYHLSPKITLSSNFTYKTGNAVTFPVGKYVLDGKVNYYYTERNAYRMPAYHRLDLGFTYYLRKTQMRESSIVVTLYNVYAKKNPFTVDFRPDEEDPSRTEAVMIYLYSFVPSVSYNFRF